VAVFATLIFFIGVFSTLFLYSSRDSKEEHKQCASGPLEMWKSLHVSGITFMLWHLFTYIPTLGALTLLSITHFRSYIDVAKNLVRIDAEQDGGGSGGRAHAAANSPDGLASKLTSGPYIRQTFLLTVALQFGMYIVLFWARDSHKPIPSGCVDTFDECRTWAGVDVCRGRGNNTGFDKGDELCNCPYENNAGALCWTGVVPRCTGLATKR
jgi:hypothetical protein